MNDLCTGVSGDAAGMCVGVDGVTMSLCWVLSMACVMVEVSRLQRRRAIIQRRLSGAHTFRKVSL